MKTQTTNLLKKITLFTGLGSLAVSCSGFGPAHIPPPPLPPAPAITLACSQSPTGNVNAVNFLVSDAAATNWTLFAAVPATNNQPVVAPAYPLGWATNYQFVAQATNTTTTNIYSDYTAPITTNVPPAPVPPSAPSALTAH